ncbi:MAG: phosphatidylserine decarboxylase family protein [Candidatus Glassbacteria bacterium]
MQIAREGIPLILIFVGMHVLLAIGSFVAPQASGWFGLRNLVQAVAFFFALLAVFSLYFFRDPERKTPAGKGLIVSPADGKVLALERVSEPDFIGGECERASIFMNMFDVHVNRSPLSGTVLLRSYRPGKFFNASLDKASHGNEALTLGIESTDGGARILVRQIAGLVARRIVCRVSEGAVVERGGRFGMIRFGSRVEVTLPAGVSWKVKPGDRVRAGETVIAELP